MTTIYIDRRIPLTKQDLKPYLIKDGAGVVTHVGFAFPGTATSEAGWQIQKLNYDGGGEYEYSTYAEGTNTYSHVMDDYATYSYS